MGVGIITPCRLEKGLNLFSSDDFSRLPFLSPVKSGATELFRIIGKYLSCDPAPIAYLITQDL